MTVAYSCRMGERGRDGAEGGDKEKGKEKEGYLAGSRRPEGKRSS